MDPNIGSIGTFTISWHGLFTALGVLIGFIIMLYTARKIGISGDAAAPAVLCGVIGGIIFARVFHVIDEWSYYSQNLVQMVKITDGGLAVFGAMLGGAVVGIIYGKITGRDMEFMARLGDVTAPGLLAGMIIGRIGCAINGDAYGTATSLPWGFTYTHANHSETTLVTPYVGHPYPVYDLLWNLMVIGVYLYLWKKRRPSGVLYLTFLSLYSLGRLIISFVRVNKEVVFGLQQAQVIAVVVMIICIPTIIYLMKTKPKTRADMLG